MRRVPLQNRNRNGKPGDVQRAQDRAYHEQPHADAPVPDTALLEAQDLAKGDVVENLRDDQNSQRKHRQDPAIIERRQQVGDCVDQNALPEQPDTQACVIRQLRVQQKKVLRASEVHL